MITITYYRYVLEPDTFEQVRAFYKETKTVKYHTELDKSVTRLDTDCPMDRARKSAEVWLQDHYGYVVISHMDQDDEFAIHSLKLSNIRSFWEALVSDGVVPVQALNDLIVETDGIEMVHLDR